MISPMEINSVARRLGFPDFTAYATHVRSELSFGIHNPTRTGELLLFVDEPEAITPDESRLAFNLGLENWDYLNQFCVGGVLTADATRMMLNVWEKTDRASQ